MGAEFPAPILMPLSPKNEPSLEFVLIPSVKLNVDMDWRGGILLFKLIDCGSSWMYQFPDIIDEIVADPKMMIK